MYRSLPPICTMGRWYGLRAIDREERMKNQEKKRLGRRAVALLVVCGVLILAAIYICCVRNGYILLNHPSRKRYPVRGVDVSHYQGTIDWEKLEDQGVEFAYIKATEGSGHVDGRFAENWEGVRETGIKAGAYHFFSFDSPAQTQLENFVNTVPAYPEMLPPTVDFEFYGDKKANPPDAEAVAGELERLLLGLEAHYGVRPVIYATPEAWEMYLKEKFERYPLWIRSVVTSPKLGKAEWTFWQYSNRGRLSGYTGGETFIDLNVYGGGREQWEEWSGSYGRAAKSAEEQGGVS